MGRKSRKGREGEKHKLEGGEGRKGIERGPKPILSNPLVLHVTLLYVNVSVIQQIDNDNDFSAFEYLCCVSMFFSVVRQFASRLLLDPPRTLLGRLQNHPRLPSFMGKGK